MTSPRLIEAAASTRSPEDVIAARAPRLGTFSEARWTERNALEAVLRAAADFRRVLELAEFKSTLMSEAYRTVSQGVADLMHDECCNAEFLAAKMDGEFRP